MSAATAIAAFLALGLAIGIVVYLFLRSMRVKVGETINESGIIESVEGKFTSSFDAMRRLFGRSVNQISEVWEPKTSRGKSQTEKEFN